ncbi:MULTISPECIES: SLC13 family permease [Desulfobacula]|uniref:Predicted citrate transporter n=2 Tax=Desulfobacula TaxID=28222 RepID=K0NLC1_DESTT|nr:MULTISPECIES: SLC13 family permease [Desulfobacula]CCK80798.1 predicted citrate transporter [Desulfobacula toluolica Tol2]SDU58146.1 Di-and tricarboxylate transporter [Desulfobacula phenolica]
MPELNLDIIVVTAILIASLSLLITEKIAVDKTAIGIMVALAITGILSPGETISGFANPAVITVGAMFLLSHGLIRTGAVGFISERILHFSKGNKTRAVFLILSTVALASAFINNTPVVVLFIPIVMGLSCECDFSPSKLLIPLSYVSILAGTCTLIGTSTNIIVSDLSTQFGFEPLSMFELSQVGIPIAIIGIVFLIFISPRILPGRTAPVCELDETKSNRYIAELIVSQNSPLIGEEHIIEYAREQLGLSVIEVFRNGNIFDPVRSPLTVKQEDILLVKGSAEDIVSCLKKQIMELAHGEENMAFGHGLKDDLIVELIVPPMSGLLREKLLSTELQNDPEIKIIAIRTRRHHYSYRKITTVKLKVGDTILVRCPREKLSKIRNSNEFIVIEDIHYSMIDTEKARMAALIFVGVVFCASTGLADILVCSLAGVFLMTLTNCLRLKDAYRSLESEVLLLIVGTIALGVAMQKTGATQLYADAFLSLFDGKSPHAVLLGVIFLSSFCTHILSNNATAVLLLPIAVTTAASFGVDPRPFIIGICFGASACFATPIGYQTNLLVYGPGRYRFSDYIKIGLPLNIIVIVLSSILIPFFWPF